MPGGNRLRHSPAVDAFEEGGRKNGCVDPMSSAKIQLTGRQGAKRRRRKEVEEATRFYKNGSKTQPEEHVYPGIWQHVKVQFTRLS